MKVEADVDQNKLASVFLVRQYIYFWWYDLTKFIQSPKKKPLNIIILASKHAQDYTFETAIYECNFFF